MATSRICSIPDCGKPHRGKGWCDRHLARWKAHGDPLGGRATAFGEAQRFFREKVLTYDGDECLIWPFSKTAHGYGWMRNPIVSRMVVVSRMVCEHANGPAPVRGLDAAHSCGKGHEGCVAKRHLSWKTHAANGSDMIAHGSSPRGERHGQVKITEEQAREIRGLRGLSGQKEIAARFNISIATVSMIQRGRRWAWL